MFVFFFLNNLNFKIKHLKIILRPNNSCLAYSKKSQCLKDKNLKKTKSNKRNITIERSVANYHILPNVYKSNNNMENLNQNYIIKIVYIRLNTQKFIVV